MKKQAQKIPASTVQIQRLTPALPAYRLLLLVPSQPYGSEGLEPVDAAQCPYFQQYRIASSCVSGSGGSCCGGFHGQSAEGETQCGWLPRILLRGQTFVLFAEDAPDPLRRQAGWN